MPPAFDFVSISPMRNGFERRLRDASQHSDTSVYLQKQDSTTQKTAKVAARTVQEISGGETPASLQSEDLQGMESHFESVVQETAEAVQKAAESVQSAAEAVHATAIVQVKIMDQLVEMKRMQKERVTLSDKLLFAGCIGLAGAMAIHEFHEYTTSKSTPVLHEGDRVIIDGQEYAIYAMPKLDLTRAAPLPIACAMWQAGKERDAPAIGCLALPVNRDANAPSVSSCQELFSSGPLQVQFLEETGAIFIIQRPLRAQAL